jgi:hypothetical protein
MLRFNLGILKRNKTVLQNKFNGYHLVVPSIVNKQSVKTSSNKNIFFNYKQAKCFSPSGPSSGFYIDVT